MADASVLGMRTNSMRMGFLFGGLTGMCHAVCRKQ